MITMDSNAISVIGDSHTFEDIYQASVDAGNEYCTKNGNAYLITIDLLLGDEETETLLVGKNISVTILGDLFQVKKLSTLILGEIDDITGSTSNGVFLSCPNIKNGYGFGSDHRVDGVTQNGNIKLYNSFIDIFGFWGFFGGEDDNHQIIDCLVNGFGRVEGTESVLSNITTQKSHGRYGVLAPKGTIKKYENISSKSSLEYKGISCSVYFNSNYAPGMTVIGGVFDGYNDGLIYAEKGYGDDDGNTITFVDSDIRNGYGGQFKDDKTFLKIVYTFKPMFLDGDNNPLTDVQTIITSDSNDEIFNGILPEEGIRLTKYVANSEDSINVNYYSINAIKDDISVTRKFEAGITYINVPFFVTASSGDEGDCCLDDIQSKLDTLQDNIYTKIEAENNIIKTAISTSTTDKTTNGWKII